jgi:hypothetical protein
MASAGFATQRRSSATRESRQYEDFGADAVGRRMS